MGFKDVMDILDRFGVAVGVLSVVAFAIWRVARWVGPRIDKTMGRLIFDEDSALRRHFAFMDRLDANQVQHGENLAKQGQALDTIVAIQKEQSDSLSKVTVALGKVSGHIERVDARSKAEGR